MAPVDASRLFSTFYSGNEVFGRQSVTLRARAAGATSEEAP
jgi:hypothetical protein